MERFADYALRALGVRLPEDYARFMDIHGKKLSDDPVRAQSWLQGLGSAHFVVGTTLAFRSRLPGFRLENVLIGYAGLKTIVINKVYEEIDEYFMLDTREGSVHAIDSFGAANRLAESFEEWIGPELLRAVLKEQYKSSLTVVIFDDEQKAEEARLKLLELRRGGFVELEDAVVVVRGQDGTVRHHQMHKLTRKGGIAGSITGLIVGSIFFSPVIGAVFGAVSGALSASLTDIGIDDRFVEDLSRKLKPGCSALFTLVRKADPERVREAFLGFGGKVLVNSVSKERETVLQEILDAAGEKTE
ncbi:DUF1269 domain-containing protein [Syntrophobacter fumaroxidans]|uniref:Membrane protein of uknown function UCP014873 n=1 Tax=Syntrophobacter fumaroxidans (strain DSM 10017 / MPOB) TaxID=335543 RepID=A0LIB7_SYNFM|nr:DUF1269 domain-containing protein [Syntrophobacter fumaroxidans]ABK17169.1 membrane protein of uknown function UCP014873 [Syntrophobacter fumaroxidans MPOB]